MRSTSISELKKELTQLSPRELAELCLKLAKYKKDNKEYLGYLVFESHDNSVFVKEVKELVDVYFEEIIKQSNLYYTKKSLRKVLRIINKYCKYIGDKALAAELHIYFCSKVKYSGIKIYKSQQIENMYRQELKKINTLVASLHEDLQLDYQNDLEKIQI
jgi:membrane-anchored protein YejM (alkaline phosphatase superfamily)